MLLCVSGLKKFYKWIVKHIREISFAFGKVKKEKICFGKIFR